MAENRAKGSGLEWYVRRGAAVRGPFSSAKVRHYVLEERLGLDDEVSADREQWLRLGSVPEVVPLQMRSGDGLAASRKAQGHRDRWRALRAIGISLLLLVAVMVTVSLVGHPDEAEVRDCAAAPTPGVLLEDCRLDGAQMIGARLAGARMANVSLARANLAEADLSDADLRYADLTGANLSYSVLAGAALKGASLRLADLTNADLRGADLSHADLSGARLGGSVLEGVDWEGTIWTDGRRCEAGGCPR